MDDTTIKAIISEIAVVIDVKTDASSGVISVYRSNGITVAINYIEDDYIIIFILKETTKN